MKFEPGERYLWDGEQEVTYIGVSSTLGRAAAVFETDAGVLHYTSFERLHPLKKKRRLWVFEFPDNVFFTYSSESEALTEAAIGFGKHAKGKFYEVESVEPV